MKTEHTIRSSWHDVRLIASLLAVSFLFVSCENETECVLNIPAGPASQTLKEFARQAQVQIVFEASSVEGVTTNSVEGRLTPGEALDEMVRGTPLYVEYDTGVFAIVRRYQIETSAGCSSRLHLAVMRRPAEVSMITSNDSFSKIF